MGNSPGAEMRTPQAWEGCARRGAGRHGGGPVCLLGAGGGGTQGMSFSGKAGPRRLGRKAKQKVPTQHKVSQNQSTGTHKATQAVPSHR